MQVNDGLQKPFQKIKHYCAYSERCHSEVREKLYSFSLRKNEVELLITALIDEGYLNEERFAIAFASGKFKLKNWGKEKIRFALKQKKISDYCINKALNAIASPDYNKTFVRLADKKLETLKSEKNIFVKKRKLKDFLQQKGYDLKTIYGFLKNI